MRRIEDELRLKALAGRIGLADRPDRDRHKIDQHRKARLIGGAEAREPGFQAAQLVRLNLLHGGEHHPAIAHPRRLRIRDEILARHRPSDGEPKIGLELRRQLVLTAIAFGDQV